MGNVSNKTKKGIKPFYKDSISEKKKRSKTFKINSETKEEKPEENFQKN